MIKKFFKEMPKVDHLINAFCLAFSLSIGITVTEATYSSGVNLAVSSAIGLAIVLVICGYRLNMLWKLFKDSLDGSPRKSSCDYIINDLS